MKNFTKKYPGITCVLIDIALVIVELAATNYKKIIREERKK